MNKKIAVIFTKDRNENKNENEKLLGLCSIVLVPLSRVPVCKSNVKQRKSITKAKVILHQLFHVV